MFRRLLPLAAIGLMALSSLAWAATPPGANGPVTPVVIKAYADGAPVSAAAPLPVTCISGCAGGGGEATAANQVTGNAHLQNLVDATPEDGTFTGTASSATTIVTTETTGFGYIAFQFTTAGTGTITVESSSDGTPGTGTTFGVQVAYVQNSASTGVMATIVNPSVGVVYVVPVTGHTVRLRISTYTTGTFVVSGVKKRGSVPLAPAMQVTASGNGLAVQGPAAHDSAVSGSPSRIAGRAMTSNYTAVASGDVADMVTTTVGVQVVRLNSIPELEWSSNVSLTDGTSTQLKASCGAGLRGYLTWFNWSSVATTTAVTISLLDGVSAKFDDDVAAGAGRAAYTFPDPLGGTAATAWNVQLSGSPTGAVKARAGGYCAP